MLELFSCHAMSITCATTVAEMEKTLFINIPRCVFTVSCTSCSAFYPGFQTGSGLTSELKAIEYKVIYLEPASFTWRQGQKDNGQSPERFHGYTLKKLKHRLLVTTTKCKNKIKKRRSPIKSHKWTINLKSIEKFMFGVWIELPST